MNTQYQIEAWEHRLLLESGISEIHEVISWADSYISTVGYHDTIADISIGKASEKDVLAKLTEISLTVDDWEGLRKASSRLVHYLELNPNSTGVITRLLENIWISSGYSEPKDFSFVVCCHDNFLIIRDSKMSSLSTFRRRLLKSLTKLTSKAPNSDR